MGKADTESAHRNNRTICLPFSQEIYDACIKNPIDFRLYIDKQIELFPELFPVGIDRGYLMKDIYHSKKQSIPISTLSHQPDHVQTHIQAVFYTPIQLRLGAACGGPQAVLLFLPE